MKYSLKSKYSFLHYFCLICLLFITNCSLGQSSSTGFLNTPQPGGDFLGWDALTNSTLEIRHDTPGENILFGTALAERMRIKPDARISINTGSSLGGTRVGILQDVASAVAVRTNVGIITSNQWAVDLFCEMGRVGNRNTGISTECIGLSKEA